MVEDLMHRQTFHGQRASQQLGRVASHIHRYQATFNRAGSRPLNLLFMESCLRRPTVTNTTGNQCRCCIHSLIRRDNSGNDYL